MAHPQQNCILIPPCSAHQTLSNQTFQLQQRLETWDSHTLPPFTPPPCPSPTLPYQKQLSAEACNTFPLTCKSLGSALRSYTFLTSFTSHASPCQTMNILSLPIFHPTTYPQLEEQKGNFITVKKKKLYN